MSATVHHIRPVEPDRLAELHAERQRIAEEDARLGVVDRRLAEATAKVADVDAALATLDRADRDAVAAWAARGGEGEAPQPLLDERRQLLTRRMEAQAEADAAKIAVDAVSPRRLELIVAHKAVIVQIRERQIAGALDQARGLRAEVEKLAGEVGQRMMRLEALRQVLSDELALAINQRDDAVATILREAGTAVNAMRAPEVLADAQTVARFAAEWRGALR